MKSSWKLKRTISFLLAAFLLVTTAFSGNTTSAFATGDGSVTVSTEMPDEDMTASETEALEVLETETAPEETGAKAGETNSPEEPGTDSASEDDGAETSAKPAESESAKMAEPSEAVETPVPVTKPSETPEAAEVEAAETTAITDYIRENIDTKYAEANQMVEADVLLVKQTLVDGMALNGDLTIDNLWASEENANAFLKMDQVYMYLYDTDEDSDYFVAFANTMHDSNAVVTDYCFAYTNLYGEVVDDCVYDRQTGLVYVPKIYTVENKNGAGVMNIQLQIMQTYMTNAVTTELEVNVDSKVKGDVANSGTVETDAMSFSTDIRLAEDKKALRNVNEDNITVAINDVPTEEFSYDEESGVLTVDYPATAIQTLDIEVEKETLAEKLSSLKDGVKETLASLFMQEKAYAANATDPDSWQGYSSAGDPLIIFSDNPSVGDTFVIRATQQYAKEGGETTFNGTTYASRVYGLAATGSTMTALEDIMYEIVAGSRSFNASDFHNASTNYHYITIDNSENLLYFAGNPYYGEDSEGGEARFAKASSFIMTCAHIGVSVAGKTGEGTWDAETGSYLVEGKMYFRILEVDTADKYVVVGAATQTYASSNQTGVGFFKIFYGVTPETGYLRVRKKSNNTTVTSGNDAYTLAGAEFGVYTSESNADNDTNRVATLTTDATGYSPFIELDANTYYIKETKASPGYYLKDEVYPEQVTSGGYTTADADISGIPEDPITKKIRLAKKTDKAAVTGSLSGYTLEGAKYSRYEGTSWSSAKSGSSVLYTTESDGTFTTETLPLCESGYYYYFKETVSSPGHRIDPTIYRVETWAGNDNVRYAVSTSTDGASWNYVTGNASRSSYGTVEYGDVVSFTATEPQKWWSFSLQKESEKPLLTTGYAFYSSFLGAEYTLYFGTSYSNKTKYGNTLETDADGFISSDTVGELPVLPEGWYYYLVETKAPYDGFDLDPYIYRYQATDIVGGNTFTLSTYKAERPDGSGEPAWGDATSTRTLTSGASAAIRSYTSNEPPVWWTLRLYKDSEVNDVTDVLEGCNNAWLMENAEYTLYYGPMLATSARTLDPSDYTAYGTYKTTYDESTGECGFTAGLLPVWTSTSVSLGGDGIYWYLVETKAPEGYALDTTIYRIRIDSGYWYLGKQGNGKFTSIKDGTLDDTSTIEVDSKEPIDTVPLRLQKESADTSLTDRDYAYYSLADADYMLYVSRKPSFYTAEALLNAEGADTAHTTYIDSYVTDKNGVFSFDDLPALGKGWYYYICEQPHDLGGNSSNGYKTDTAVYRLQVWRDGDNIMYTLCKTNSANTSYAEVKSGSILADGGMITETITVTSKEPPKDIRLKMKKQSGSLNITYCYLDNLKPGYSLAGAEYTVYAPDGTTVDTYTTDENGEFVTDPLPMLEFHTESGGDFSWCESYTVKETKPSPGYELDPTEYFVEVCDAQNYSKGSADGYAPLPAYNDNVYCRVTRSLDGTRTEGNAVLVASGSTVPLTDSLESAVSNEPPKYVYLGLRKQSANSILTDGNACYSLEGAEYTLYTGTSWETAEVLKEADIDVVYTTNESGEFSTKPLPLPADGYYYFIKETKASPGYELDNTVYRLRTWDAREDGKVSYELVSDASGKGDFDAVKNAEATTVSGTADSGKSIDITSAEPPKYWNLKLKKESADKALTSGSYSLEGAEYTLYYGASDDISRAAVFDGAAAYIPTGTCSTIPPVNVKTVACAGFTLSSDAVVCVTTQYMWQNDATLDVNGTGAYPVYYGGAAYDYDAYEINDGAAVYFKFDGAHWNIIDGAEAGTGAAVYTTDENGYFMTGDLPVASGYYFLKETKPSPGYQLDTSYYRFRVSDVPGTDNVTYKVEKATLKADGMYSFSALYQETTGEAAPVTFDLTTENARSYEPPKYWNLKLQKESANKKLTDGNDCYSLAGAEYTLYYGTTGSISGASVFSGVTAVTPGTCSTISPVNEKTVTCDGFTLSDGAIVCVTTQYEWSGTGNETLNVNGTGAYPVYYNGSVYDSDAFYIDNGDSVYFQFNEVHWNIVEASDISGSVCRTDENGYFMTNSLPIAPGYYFLKETKASKGYELDTGYYRIKVSDVAGTDNVTYKVEKATLKTDGTYSFSTLYQETAGEAAPVMFDLTTEDARSYEPPANDPFYLTLQKGDRETMEPVPQGDVLKLSGAIFELTYYDNTDGDTSGDALKTWYFKTDEDGVLNCRDKKYYISREPLSTGVIVSDDLYMDNDEVVYPVGTYVIKEISAPVSYTTEGIMRLDGTTDAEDVKNGLKFVLKRSDTPEGGKYGVLRYLGDVVVGDEIEATNLAVEAFDDPHIVGNRIKVVKKGNDDKLLEGVTYRLVGDNGDTYEATTDENGEAVFEDILPQYYTLTEIKTLDGYTLLADNIRIRLPYSVTDEEAKKQSIDLTNAEYDEASGAWVFYKQTYTITNHGVYHVPLTGASMSEKIWIPLVCGIILLGCVAFITFKRKRKA